MEFVRAYVSGITFFLNLPPVPSENARQSQWYNKNQWILISFYQKDKHINIMTIKIMKNEQLQCKNRKVHCQFYNKNQDILKMLCPQARRHSSIFHTFEALGLGWPAGAWGWPGDGLGRSWVAWVNLGGRLPRFLYPVCILHG